MYESQVHWDIQGLNREIRDPTGIVNPEIKDPIPHHPEICLMFLKQPNPTNDIYMNALKDEPEPIFSCQLP